MAKRANITPDLARKMDAAEPANLVDVVVELEGPGEEAPDMAAAKESFARAAAPVEELISGCGGEVVEGAWLNQTLRARVPARAVHDVACADGVSGVDVPHAIEAE